MGWVVGALAGALMFKAAGAQAQAFQIDVGSDEIHDLDQSIRADDLAVYDIAYFDPDALCLQNSQLFLPSIIRPQTPP